MEVVKEKYYRILDIFKLKNIAMETNTAESGRTKGREDGS